MRMKLFENNSLIPLVILLVAAGLPSVVAAQEDPAKAMKIVADPLTGQPPETAEAIQQGRKIYESACIYCHGNNGAGNGPVSYFLSRDTGPHPRDFTSGLYKFRSTPSGYLPADEDIFRTITDGIKGFMPSFAGLDVADRWRLVYYLKSLYPDFQDNETEFLEVVGAPIPSSGASIERGSVVYQGFKCWECHGGGGEGNGEKAADLRDDWNFSLPPQNLTRPSAFKNGNEPVDIYRTVMTGLDGGAMASYGDFFEGNEQDAWHLVNYILSLSAE